MSNNAPPDIIRGILPNDIKTEIIITANIREWRHIFNLRCSKRAHKDMKRIMDILLLKFLKSFDYIFDDIGSKYKDTIFEHYQ